ncbi:hypothetical protein FB470_000698 [Amycolatopsis thermophila]|uniref:Uncharacterized protein n=1 Tax=Amycolatopsis thermophila TaxID=206084 RepID=A0ABU0ENF6_9PSEU|nr:hypothetical protein [Amycolatopsis thermophila]
MLGPGRCGGGWRVAEGPDYRGRRVMLRPGGCGCGWCVAEGAVCPGGPIVLFPAKRGCGRCVRSGPGSPGHRVDGSTGEPARHERCRARFGSQGRGRTRCPPRRHPARRRERRSGRHPSADQHDPHHAAHPHDHHPSLAHNHDRERASTKSVDNSAACGQLHRDQGRRQLPVVNHTRPGRTLFARPVPTGRLRVYVHVSLPKRWPRERSTTAPGGPRGAIPEVRAPARHQGRRPPGRRRHEPASVPPAGTHNTEEVRIRPWPSSP